MVSAKLTLNTDIGSDTWLQVICVLSLKSQ